MNMMDGGSGWMGMMLLSVFFWVLIVVGVVLIVKWLLGGKGQGDPMEILKERYARGEIDREAFLRMKRDLEERSP